MKEMDFLELVRIQLAFDQGAYTIEDNRFVSIESNLIGCELDLLDFLKFFCFMNDGKCSYFSRYKN